MPPELFTPVRWVAFVILAGLFLQIAVFNVACLLPVWKRRAPSIVPFVGGLLGVWACSISPIEPLHPRWWLPFVLDVSFPLFLQVIPRLLKEAWRTSRWNLLTEYQFTDRIIGTVTLRLFKKDVCLLYMSFVRRPSETGMVEASLLGVWSSANERLTVRTGDGVLRLRILSDNELELEETSGSHVDAFLRGQSALRLTSLDKTT